MARMIPNNVTEEEFHGSFGEAQIYEALKKLPDEYIVFHSVHWHKRKLKGRIIWGESDFTIFHPKRGLLVIEVKSGGIRHDEEGWHQTNILTQKEYRMKDPLVQAERSKFTFVDLIEPSSSEIHTYWVESAVWFPSVEDYTAIGQMPLSYSSEIVFTRKDLSNPVHKIKAAFDYYGMREKLYYCLDDEKHVINILSPKFDAVPGMLANIDEENYIFNRMTQEQSYLLDYLEEQRVAVIQGGAGTGKTMLAIEKAKRVAEEEKVLFLCFNKFLLNSLRSVYSENNPNIDFYNLQGLVCNQMGVGDAGGNEGITQYLNDIDLDKWPYKHIVIDEGQDFLEEHLELLSNVAELQEGCFYVFYDKNQLVQQRQELNWVKSVECRLILSVNCRNTKSIAVTSNKPIGVEKIKMRIEVPGNKPNLYLLESTGKVVGFIEQLIRKYISEGLTRKDIVILTVKTEKNSILSGVSSLGSYRLTQEYGDSGILFTTARKFKGLESAVIILVDMDEKTFQDEESKRVLYVGMSRAKNYLDLVNVLDDNQLSKIATALSGKVSKNAKATISSQLKVRIAKNQTDNSNLY